MNKIKNYNILSSSQETTVSIKKVYRKLFGYELRFLPKKKIKVHKVLQTVYFDKNLPVLPNDVIMCNNFVKYAVVDNGVAVQMDNKNGDVNITPNSFFVLYSPLEEGPFIGGKQTIFTFKSKKNE